VNNVDSRVESSREGSVEGFSVPKASMLGDLKKIYNPNFHIHKHRNVFNIS
jgi:hypothetical protein